MRKLFLLILVLALGAGAYYYAKSKKDGPTGALVQAVAAVRAHDMASFEKFVDVSSVTSHLVDNMSSQSAVVGALVPGGGLMMGGALRLLKPTLAKAARKEVAHYVETGSLETAASQRPVNLSILGLAGKVVSPDSKFSGIKYATEQGEQALVGLEFTQPRYDTTMVVEVKMLHRGDHWQMTEITNTGELLRNAASLEKRRMLK